jgi:hypothetical protein
LSEDLQGMTVANVNNHHSQRCVLLFISTFLVQYGEELLKSMWQYSLLFLQFWGPFFVQASEFSVGN